MSEFFETLEEYLGDADAISDIRVAVRRLWFYDFVDNPVRLWQGKGKLHTTDGNEWLGTIGGNNTDYHRTPALQDGRDNTSPTYNFSMPIIDLPGQTAFQLYEALKAQQSLAVGRKITCYLAIFKEGEALRPQTPIIYFKELVMRAPTFSETLEPDAAGTLIRRYVVTVPAKDGNSGRTNLPNGTYADTIQRERARQLGVTLDRGCEYLALLANRTYKIP